MPSITLSKKELFASLGKKLSDEQLKEKISMLGTDLESIEDDNINVEIFPNRPDLLSQQGFARAMASFLDIRPGLSSFTVKKGKEQVIVDPSVKECRPYTACAIIRNIRLNEERLKEIIQIQEKLHITFGRNRKRAAIGIYPMEHITFPITFKGMKPSEIKFRPLEASKEMTAKQILEEHPKGKEYAHLMEGLKKYAVFVDAKKNILSLTPLINSHLTGKVSVNTTELFVECSGFDYRILSECLNMIVTSLADMGGTIESVELVDGKKQTSPQLTPWKMKADKEYINSLVGVQFSEKELAKMLGRMGIGYEKGAALIPAYRTDILHQADLAEDVAIGYGYDNIKEELPAVVSVGSEASIEKLSSKVRDILIGHGLQEVKNFNLIAKESQTKRMQLDIPVLQVQHAVSEEYDTLRAWVFPSLLETLKRNKRHEYPQGIFEIGRVFTAKGEKIRVAVALCGEEENYTTARQVLDDVFARLGMSAIYKETEHSSFIPGRVARVTVEKEVAYIGELHPQVLVNFDLAMPVAGFELNLSEL